MSLDENISDPENQSLIMLGELIRVADDYFVKTGKEFPQTALLLGNNWVLVGHITRPISILSYFGLGKESNEPWLAVPRYVGRANPNVSLAVYLEPLVENTSKLAVLPIGERRRLEAEQLPDRRNHEFYFEAKFKGTELYVFTKIPQEYAFVSSTTVRTS